MELSELLCGTRVWATSLADLRSLEVSGVSTDSRTVSPGDVFVALDGAHTSGEEHISEAIGRGAPIVVGERRFEGVPFVAVEDARRAAAVMWNRFLGSPAAGLDVICVTGTCAKSSVSSILHHILCTFGIKSGLIGTLGAFCGDEPMALGGESELSDFPSAMTTPDPKYLYGALAEMKRRGCRAAVIEASSHAIAQRKLAPVSPKLSVFTNLSPEHLDFHGNMENYLRSKARLFCASESAVLYGGDPASALIATYVSSGDVSFVSESGVPGDFIFGGETPDGLDGVSFILSSGGRTILMKAPVAGDFAVVNCALAAAAAIRFGCDPDKVAAALCTVPPLPGRMEVIYRGAFTVVRDFAHTPQAMRRALGFVKRQTKRRVVCVFGCGGDRDNTKRAPMGEIAASLCDLAVVTNDNPRTEDPDAIIGDILEGCRGAPNVRVIPDRRKAIEFALSVVGEGDCAALLGKGHETWQIDAAGKHPFDEREIVRSILSGK